MCQFDLLDSWLPLIEILLKTLKTQELRRTGTDLERGDRTSQFLLAKEEAILDTGVEYGKVPVMNTARKISVEVPEKLLERAQEASGEGITQTVRTGLRLVAASRTYARLRELRGKVKFSRTAADLKDDR